MEREGHRKVAFFIANFQQQPIVNGFASLAAI
jgi:hypothetical protein